MVEHMGRDLQVQFFDGNVCHFGRNDQLQNLRDLTWYIDGSLQRPSITGSYLDPWILNLPDREFGPKSWASPYNSSPMLSLLILGMTWWTQNSEGADQVVPVLVVLRSRCLTCLSLTENPLAGVHQGTLEIQGFVSYVEAG